MATRAAVQVLGVILLGAAFVAGGGGAGAPTLTTSLPRGAVLHPGQVVEFTVEASNPPPGVVSITLLNPPPSCVYTQDARTGIGNRVKGAVRWLVPNNYGGLHRLLFREDSGIHPARPHFTSIDVRVDGYSENSPVQIGDVTGDGVLDVVAGAQLADISGVVDAGAIYVWKGTTSPSGVPDATLTVPGALFGDVLGYTSVDGGQGIQLADVTADGVLDIVAGTYPADIGGVVNAGAIYVWGGGPALSGSQAPLATLTVARAIRDDYLCFTSGQGIQLADVTGDHLLDVIAGTEYADVGSDWEVGTIYVWEGGPSIRGSHSPWATLRVPGALKGDRLGLVNTFSYSFWQVHEALRLGDVTADGMLDVIAGATLAGSQDTGAIYVWEGGPSLIGSHAPLATLKVPNAGVFDGLGIINGQEIPLADLTGDGVLDVISGTVRADVAGISDIGAIYVWEGGSALNGSPAPWATLAVPGAVVGDQLGSMAPGIPIADVTGDGLLDVVAGAIAADVAGVKDVGAIYVWEGGALLKGSPLPRATLTVPGASPSDLLGSTNGPGIPLVDATGDCVLDIVTGAVYADVAGVKDVGAIYVWKGGTTLRGSLPPDATLTVQGAAPFDFLGASSYHSIQFADITGDASVDIVAGAQSADIAGVKNVGAIYIWEGGSMLTGSPAPLATLTVPGAIAGDYLGFMDRTSQGIQLVDVTGDYMLDVVAGAIWATVGGVPGVGAVYVWQGGSTLRGSLAPLATLTVPAAVSYDSLGVARGQGIQIVDVTGDRVSDLIVGAGQADIAGLTNVGAIHVWKGGSTLRGSLAPYATLTIQGATAFDYLGGTGGQGIQLADLTGDGLLDVVANTSLADIAGVKDSGAIYVWTGGLTLSGSPALLATLNVPGATAFDQLGR